MGLSYEEFVQGYREVYEKGTEHAVQTIEALAKAEYTLFKVYVQPKDGVMSEEEFERRKISRIPGETVVGPYLLNRRLVEEPGSRMPRLTRARLLGVALYVGSATTSDAPVDSVE